MNIYDRIMKEIFMSQRSDFVAYLAGQQPDMPATGEIGGILGYHVDYYARLNHQSHIHVEFQTASDKTMHWRMVNYYVLLHKFAHRWKNEDISIKQFLIYLGARDNTMFEQHPHFGEPYAYKTINLISEDAEDFDFLTKSSFYGDWLMWVLIGEGRTIEDWRRCFRGICNLQDEDERIIALFNLAHLAPLREFKNEVQEWVRKMNISEALRDSGIGYDLALQVAKESVVKLAERYLRSIQEDKLDDDEINSLTAMDQDDLTNIVMEFVSGQRTRESLRYGAGIRP